MSPFGHAAVVYIAAHKMKKQDRLIMLLGGVLPDVDFLLFPFSFFNSIHRVATHNVFFLAFAALVAAFLAKQEKWRRALLLLIGILIHIFIDSVLDNNPTNGIGVALFYPVSRWMFSPFNLTPPVESLDGWSNLGQMLQHMGDGLMIEVPFCLAAVGIFIMDYRRRQRIVS